MPCKVDCIRNLKLSLQRCALKISDAIFNKANLRNETWWLSTFYVLCIQSIVRKVLIVLDSREPTDIDHEPSRAHDHFRLAGRLFTPISGRYDFVNSDLSMELPSSEEDISRIEKIKAAAQSVVKQQMWPTLGFSCFGDFLKHIFEDKDLHQSDGRDHCGGGLGSAVFAIHPKPYVPQSSDMDSYCRFRVDWDMARCNYTKQVVFIGSKHGWSSKIYVLTAKKQAAVEALWKQYSKTAIANVIKNTRVSPTKGMGLEQFFENQENQGQEERFPQPLIYASLRQHHDHPQIEGADKGDQPQKQSPRFDGDLYWPRWIHGQEDTVQEGWCGMCTPGCWLPLDGPFQDDKDFKHGVSAVTGKAFDNPREVRQMRAKPAIWWGLCGTCGEWVELLGSKSAEVAWFVHSFRVCEATFHHASDWSITDSHSVTFD
jgi:hypothetical protein